MPLLELAALAGAEIPKLIGQIPGVPKSIGDLGTTMAGIGGATARTTGLITGFEAAKAFWSNGGWVANVAPRQVIVSAGINGVVAGAVGYIAYQGGVAIGASAYATGQTIAGYCQ